MTRKSFSDQIRKAIDASGLSRYEVCKRVEVDQSTMSKFMHGMGGLSMVTLVRLTELLGLVVVTKAKLSKEK
jgi:transcriptional regulator with XRE-family HTH domain